MSDLPVSNEVEVTNFGSTFQWVLIGLQRAGIGPTIPNTQHYLLDECDFTTQKLETFSIPRFWKEYGC